jgi:hypothetical protein
LEVSDEVRCGSEVNTPKCSLEFTNTLALNKGNIKEEDKEIVLFKSKPLCQTSLVKKETRENSLFQQVMIKRINERLGQTTELKELRTNRLFHSEKVIPLNKHKKKMSLARSVKDLKPMWEEYRQKPSNEILKDLLP